MDYSKGYTSRWRVERIDPSTWEPCGTLQGVQGITVERDCTDDAPLLETASLTALQPALQAFEDGWHRIVMEASQGGVGAVVPVATLWLESGKSGYDRGYREDSLSGRSTLWQASDAQAGDGRYAPKGADGPEFAASLLRGCIDAPVHVEGSARLEDHIVFDLDSSVLEAAWAVLSACGCCIQLDGRGEVHVLPMPTRPALSIDSSCGIMPETSSDGATVAYEREYAPDVHPFSVVRGALPDRGLPEGLYRVQTQKLTCDRGIRVEETVEAIA